MPKKGLGIYYPRRDSEVVKFFKTAVAALVTLAAKYGISAGTITTLQTHTTTMEAAEEQVEADTNQLKTTTVTKNEAFAAGKLDILRVFNRIQRAANFAEGDATTIGFRVITAPVDLKTVKPVVAGITVDVSMVIIDWVRGQMEGIIVYGSYNGNDFTEIGRDFRSPFEDTRKNQTDQPEERYYRLRYMKSDKAIGLFSSIEKVIVAVF